MYVPPSPKRRPGSTHIASLQQCRSDEVVEYLRQAKHLSVVEIHLIEHKDGYFAQPPNLLERRAAWKKGLVDVLKKSPSRDRKVLRWKVAKIYWQPLDRCLAREVVEAEELEV